MKCVERIKIVNAERNVRVFSAVIVRVYPTAIPRELQLKGRPVVYQKRVSPRAVLWSLNAVNTESQSLLAKLDGLLVIQNVGAAVNKTCLHKSSFDIEKPRY